MLVSAVRLSFYGPPAPLVPGPCAALRDTHLGIEIFTPDPGQNVIVIVGQLVLSRQSELCEIRPAPPRPAPPRRRPGL